MPPDPARQTGPSDQPTVLVTRPEPGASRFAAQAAARGLRCVVAPLMRIVAVDHDPAPLAQARGLVFTSAHAIAAAGPGRGRPAFCVGPATADAARAAGFRVTQGPGDAAGLAPMLAGLGDGWVHPHGRHVTTGLPLPGVVVYDQVPCPLAPAAAALLAGTRPLLVPVFSPRSARLAADAMTDARAELRVAAISAAAADRWSVPCARLVIAATPDTAGMLDALETLRCRETSPPPAG